MPDIDHTWGTDLLASPSGDLATVDGLDQTTERVIRRLMTGQGSYYWHTLYGAGLPARVGEIFQLQVVQAIISSQIFLEASVAHNPPPVITTAPILNGVSCTIQYWDRVTGQQTTLSFDINK